MMKDSKIKSKIEVYVCNFGKECSKRGGPELADNLKKWAKEEHKGEIKVVRSGCLGECDDACVIAIYPEKKLLLQVEEDDLKEVKQGLEETLRKQS